MLPLPDQMLAASAIELPATPLLLLLILWLLLLQVLLSSDWGCAIAKCSDRVCGDSNTQLSGRGMAWWSCVSALH
jgi:hypothetical protein